MRIKWLCECFTTVYRTKCSLLTSWCFTEQTLRSSFCSGTKDNWRKNKYIYTPCVNTSRHKSVFPPYQLWLCSSAGRCQRFPQNNVTRRGIPVRPGGGGTAAQTEQAGWRHFIWLRHPPGDPSLTLPPSFCLCWRGRNLTSPANCWLPNSSLT